LAQPRRTTSRKTGGKKKSSGIKVTGRELEDLSLIPPMRQTDVQAIKEASIKSLEGIQAVLHRHREILQQSLSELKAVGKVMRSVGTRESIAHLDDLGRGVVSLTMSSVRELANLASATQLEAFKLLDQRLREDIGEYKRLRDAKLKPSTNL
jgi:phasin family protein